MKSVVCLRTQAGTRWFSVLETRKDSRQRLPVFLFPHRRTVTGETAPAL